MEPPNPHHSLYVLQRDLLGLSARVDPLLYVQGCQAECRAAFHFHSKALLQHIAAALQERRWEQLESRKRQRPLVVLPGNKDRSRISVLETGFADAWLGSLGNVIKTLWALLPSLARWRQSILPAESLWDLNQKMQMKTDIGHIPFMPQTVFIQIQSSILLVICWHYSCKTLGRSTHITGVVSTVKWFIFWSQRTKSELLAYKVQAKVLGYGPWPLKWFFCIRIKMTAY